MIDQQNFKPLGVPVDPRLDEPQVQKLRNETIVFLQSVLLSNTGYMPREEYREMIELCLLLGVSTVEGKGSASGTYHFRLPGAYHLARFYCFKIYLFREQFQLTVREKKTLDEFCMFASHVYVRAWISCPLLAIHLSMI